MRKSHLVLVLLFIASTALLLPLVRTLAQAPVVATFPSLPNATTGATSYAYAISPVVSTSPVAALLLKPTGGVVYKVRASNPAAAGFLVLLNTPISPAG